MLAQSYRGSGGSFGYPASPNPADQKQLLALLGAEKIGITLSVRPPSMDERYSRNREA